jgi:splicing factor U2AF subunit
MTVSSFAEAEKVRMEQQAKARQMVLQQQATSAAAAASKTQREVYIGNLQQVCLVPSFGNVLAVCFMMSHGSLAVTWVTLEAESAVFGGCSSLHSSIQRPLSRLSTTSNIQPP